MKCEGALTELPSVPEPHNSIVEIDDLSGEAKEPL